MRKLSSETNRNITSGLPTIRPKWPVLSALFRGAFGHMLRDLRTLRTFAAGVIRTVARPSDPPVSPGETLAAWRVARLSKTRTTHRGTKRCPRGALHKGRRAADTTLQPLEAFQRRGRRAPAACCPAS